MKKTYVSFFVILALLFVNASYGATGTVARIVKLADSLKATLTATQISTLELTYSYANSQTWSNLPVTMQTRIGIRMGDITAAQQGIVKAIVKEVSGTNTANEGYDEAAQLFLADDNLAANGGGTAYGAGQYYLCFNGTPSLMGLFSIKFGGHHLQIENTYNKGGMLGATPHFEAVEPLTFTSGGTSYSPITQEKNALAGMFSTLSTTDLATAKLSTTFTDILMGAKNGGTSKDWIFPATKVGLKVGTLTATQKALVLDAIKTYVLDIDNDHANAIIAQYTKELDETYIAFSGNSALTTKNDYARIDGPGVWIEFTVQGGIIYSGVHYHSIWRDHIRDYGGGGSPNGIVIIPIGDTTMTGIETNFKKDNLVALKQSFPNPTADLTIVPFVLNTSGSVTILVYDNNGKVVGTVVENKYYSSGTYTLPFSRNNNRLPSGFYYFQMTFNSGDNVIKKSMPFVIQ